MREITIIDELGAQQANAQLAVQVGRDVLPPRWLEDCPHHRFSGPQRRKSSVRNLGRNTATINRSSQNLSILKELFSKRYCRQKQQSKNNWRAYIVKVREIRRFHPTVRGAARSSTLRLAGLPLK